MSLHSQVHGINDCKTKNSSSRSDNVEAEKLGEFTTILENSRSIIDGIDGVVKDYEYLIHFPTL
jgi:hypothetical protein